MLLFSYLAHKEKEVPLFFFFFVILTFSWKTKLSQCFCIQFFQPYAELLLSFSEISNFYSMSKRQPVCALTKSDTACILHTYVRVLFKCSKQSMILGYSYQRSCFPNGKRLALTGLQGGHNLLPLSLADTVDKGLTVQISRHFLEIVLHSNVINVQIPELVLYTSVDFLV